MRGALIAARLSVLLAAELGGGANASAETCESSVSTDRNVPHICDLDPSDAGCKPPLDLSVAERWLSARKARLAASEKNMDERETALKLAETKAAQSKPPAATPDHTDFYKAREDFLLQRHCVAQAEEHVEGLKVNLGKVRMWRKRLSVALFRGLAAGNASQLGASGAFAWTVSPNIEAEVALGGRRIYHPDPGGSSQVDRGLWTLRFRALFGAKAPVHVGATFATGDLQKDGVGAYVIPEVGAILRLKSDRVCDGNENPAYLFPWGLGLSIEPVVPLNSKSGPLMVMFNLTVELGTNWPWKERMLDVEMFEDWYRQGRNKGEAKKSLGCK